METPSTLSDRPSRVARYCDLFDRMSDPVFLLDPTTFGIVDMNPSAENRFGENLTNLMSKSLETWIEQAHIEAFERILRVARRSYYPRKIRFPWRIVDNSLFFEATVCALELPKPAGSTDEEDHNVIQVILNDVTKEVETATKLEALSTQDEMTKIANFRRFKAELMREHERVIIDGGHYSIVFCDVDHFKSYNDRCGHPAGDKLLAGLADILRAKCRTTDLAARYGGEEFAILCRGTKYDGASIFAERVRAAVEAAEFEGGKDQPLGKISISIGVAGYPRHGGTPEDVLKSADKALYKSKEAGRNRVTIAE